MPFWLIKVEGYCVLGIRSDDEADQEQKGILWRTYCTKRTGEYLSTP